VTTDDARAPGDPPPQPSQPDGFPAPRASAVQINVVLALLLFIVALAPRAAWLSYADGPPHGLNDPFIYNQLADRIADGKGYTRESGEAFAYYPPGYPLALGAVKKGGDVFGWGRDAASGKAMNVVAGAISSVLVFGIALRIADRTVAVVAGLAHAFFPSQVLYTGVLLSEPIFTMLFLASLLALVWRAWGADGVSPPHLWLAAFLLGCATVVRGITLLFPFAVLVPLLWVVRPRTHALGQAAVLFAGVLLFVVPLTIRNSVAFGQFVGPSTNVGDDLCIGNHEGAPGHFDFGAPCLLPYDGSPLKDFELRRDELGRERAISYVLHNPADMPGLLWSKAYHLLRYDDDGLFAAESYGNDQFIEPGLRSALSRVANLAYYLAGVLAIVGVPFFLGRGDPRRILLVVSMAYVLMVPLIFFGDPRFHFPAVPLAIIIASATAVGLLRGVQTRWRARRMSGSEYAAA
jgi:hypothetical protein